jgi:hypothetical protein
MFVETKREGEIAVPVEPWRALLLRAADYMERHGHCKKVLRYEGAVCLRGALWFCDGDKWVNLARELLVTEAGRAVKEYLNLPEFHDEISWNNAPERTKQEVITAMRAAAGQ